MSFQIINTGTYNRDATGDKLRIGFEKVNSNFALVFPAYLPVNVGTNPNDGTGDTLYAAAGKINANFTYLFAQPGGSPALQQIINIANGPFNGVIGLGDPGVLEWIKINENFAFLEYLT